MNVKGYRCIACNEFYDFAKDLYVCPACGGNTEIEYDYEKVKSNWKKEDLLSSKDFSLWRYLPLYPVRTGTHIPLIGGTPLYKSSRLNSFLGVENLFIKDECKNPTASLKDRASAIAVSRAIEKKYRVIGGASTGNAGSSTAGIASASGINTVIFIPINAPVAKRVQLQIYGAKVICVKGSYDDSFQLCIKACDKFGWFNRNTGYNPFTREGKKSVAFEICEQLNWDVPETIVIPVGDGNIFSGIWKGFRDFYKIGFIERLPRLIAVQAEKSNSVEIAFRTGAPVSRVSGETVADSISVSLPRDGEAAVKAIKESGGGAVTVSDREILEMIPVVAKNTGVFVEPAAAAAVSGLVKALEDKKIDRKEKIATILTGSGLKDIESAMKVAPATIEIENSIDELD